MFNIDTRLQLYKSTFLVTHAVKKISWSVCIWQVLVVGLIITKQS